MRSESKSQNTINQFRLSSPLTYLLIIASVINVKWFKMRFGMIGRTVVSIDIMRSILSFIFTFIYKLFITSFVVLYEAILKLDLFMTLLIYCVERNEKRVFQTTVL